MSTRSIIDQVFYREKQRTDSRPLVFDTTALPVKLKLPARLFKPGEIKPIVTIHCTDVRGGFGLAKYQIAAARKLLELGKVPAELALQLPFDIDDASYILALLIRYSGDAYHRLASRRVGDVINHPLTLRTSHGNTGNFGPGWAVDAAHDEVLPRELVAYGVASLTAHVLDVHRHCNAQVILAPHRAWASDRLRDPGLYTWQGIVLEVVRQLGPDVVVIGYGTKAGSGRPVGNDWDPNALYDVKGRPLRQAA